jgi:hypothetical protein
MFGRKSKSHKKINWDFVLRELHLRRNQKFLNELSRNKAFLFTTCLNCGWQGNLAHTHLHSWQGMDGECWARFLDAYQSNLYDTVFCPYCEAQLNLNSFRIKNSRGK